MENSNINKTLARNLRSLLASHGMTQEQLANKLGVSNQSVSNWCSGQKSPRMDKIDKMCEIFKCSRSDLLSDVVYKYVGPDGRTLDISAEVQIPYKAVKEYQDKHILSYTDLATHYFKIKEELNQTHSEELKKVTELMQEKLLLDKFRQLNDKGKEQVIEFASKLRDDPNYQSDDLVREMFNRYIKAGLITNLSGGDEEDVGGTNKKRKDQV